MLCLSAAHDTDFQPGDLLFFAGDDLVSKAIAWKTCSWPQWIKGERFSHVGVCADYSPPNSHSRVTLLFESTTLTAMPCVVQNKLVKGPQAHWPNERIKRYPGHVWRLRLRDPLTEYERERLTNFSLSVLGEDYDWFGAALAGTWFARLDDDIQPHAAALFCSRMATLQLRECFRMSQSDAPGEFSPARLARELAHRETVWPIEAAGTKSYKIK